MKQYPPYSVSNTYKNIKLNNNDNNSYKSTNNVIIESNSPLSYFTWNSLLALGINWQNIGNLDYLMHY